MRWVVPTAFLPPSGRRLALGLGLIGIGKPWGHIDDQVPEEAQVSGLLRKAVALGIRFFDTAPSYGVSEERFGRFLRQLAPGVRDGLTIATKFGEHWDAEKGKPFTDHRYDALVRSVDGSMARLGRIDFLELHKTSPEALRSRDVERAFTYAASLGIRNLGASVSDLASAEIVLAHGGFSVLQIPFHPESVQFREVAAKATDAGLLVLTNRPFGMGRLLYEREPVTPRAAFRFLAGERFDGVVLTGTKSAGHLQENWTAFQASLPALGPTVS